MEPAHIKALYTYPIKSCAPISLETAFCTETGIEHDREWAIVDALGEVMTQRQYPEMALIQPFLSRSATSESMLTLTAPGLPPYTVTINQSAQILDSQTNIWGQEISSRDQGDDAARWLSRFLTVSCRLVRSANSSRHSKYGQTELAQTSVQFADCCPISIVSEASVADLASKVKTNCDMSRFRPNLVLAGVDAYIEEQPQLRLETETLSMTAVKPISRCAVVDVEQNSGEFSHPSLFAEMKQVRLINNAAILGQYFAITRRGRVSIGQEVRFELACMTQ